MLKDEGCSIVHKEYTPKENMLIRKMINSLAETTGMNRMDAKHMAEGFIDDFKESIGKN